MILDVELFGKIAQALISDYKRIYRVNINTNEYCRYYIDQESHSMSEAQKGDDFFRDLAGAIGQVVYEEDKHIFQTEDIKEKLIKQLRNGRHYSFVYRIMVNGEPVYHTMRLIYEYVDGDEYFIIGVINVDKTVRRQKDVDEKAYIDILTGALNTNAYQEWEEKYQLLIEQDKDLQFGIVVSDVNNLKIINDTMGHKAGDELLQSAYTLLCNTFSHSIVYRVGGDEFVVVLNDTDYEKRVELFNGLRETIINNQNNGEGIVLATGMSIYIKETDKNLSEVFQRADEEMYANKRNLKENVNRINKSQEEHKKIEKVPAIRKARLDSFFRVFKMAAGKGNIFFCDIRYDFSRWDKQVVENYGLPSEYMFNAGGIWEERIHPSDKENYSKNVERAFEGGRDEFELSYRVKENSGNYVPCTCKALVVRNQHGEPEYFGGALFISEGDTKAKIPEERKQQLNSLFDALSIISDDSNVYLCDMHYDYSRWSKGLVEEFGMPSEYMYNAGGIWEEHVHPQDRQAYRDMMDRIFHFKTNGLDLQYRARRSDGEYNVCSGLGMLIKDEMVIQNILEEQSVITHNIVIQIV